MKNLYFFALSALLGIELFLGISIAPLIFFPQKFHLDIPLNHFQSGVLMSAIFVRFGYLLLVGSAFGIIYSFWNKNKVLIVISLLILGFTGIFVFYCTPLILQAQDLHATLNEEFAEIHSLSEYLIRAIAILQIISLVLLLKDHKR